MRVSFQEERSSSSTIKTKPVSFPHVSALSLLPMRVFESPMLHKDVDRLREGDQELAFCINGDCPICLRAKLALDTSLRSKGENYH